MVMRALMIGRIFWQRDGALPLDQLECFVAAAPVEIDAALSLLVAEGFAELSDEGLLRLTERAAADLVSDGVAVS